MCIYNIVCLSMLADMHTMGLITMSVHGDHIFFIFFLKTCKLDSSTEHSGEIANRFSQLLTIANLVRLEYICC